MGTIDACQAVDAKSPPAKPAPVATDLDLAKLWLSGAAKLEAYFKFQFAKGDLVLSVEKGVKARLALLDPGVSPDALQAELKALDAAMKGLGKTVAWGPKTTALLTT